MSYNKYSVRKYFVSTTLATAFVFSTMLAGGASAHGGPDSEATSNDTSVTEHEQVAATESAPVNKSNMSKGDQGEPVKALQTSLQNKGYTANPDGIFGQETEKAVTNLQSSNDLAEDGIVGPATKEVLSLTVTTEATETTTPVSNTEDVASAEPTYDSKEATVTHTSTGNQSDVVSIANGLIGKPYTPGGTTPAGFDSSGFINYAFDQAGISLNRTHGSMWVNNGTHVNSPSVGDVVFFEGTYKDGVSHSGIYLGDNQMVHAGTEQTGVEVTSMGYDYWQDRYIGAKTFN